MPTVFNSSSTEGLVASLGFFAAAGIISYYRGRKAPIITRNLKRFIGLVRTAQLTSVEGYVERVEKRRLLDSLSLTGDLDMAMPLGIGDYNYFACLEAANPNGRAIVFRERYRNWSGSRHSNIDASGRDRISLATLARTCRHLGIVGEALPEISMALVTDDGPMSLEKIARMLAEARERGLIES